MLVRSPGCIKVPLSLPLLNHQFHTPRYRIPWHYLLERTISSALYVPPLRYGCHYSHGRTNPADDLP